MSVIAKTVDFLIKKAKQKGFATYTEVADYLGIRPQGVGRILCLISALCFKNNLHPLTAIVVRANSYNPGEGFWAMYPEVKENEKEIKWAEMTEEVFLFDWETVPRKLFD
jgi:hypothetical protein